jgi:acyl-CoA thioesterase FadM
MTYHTNYIKYYLRALYEALLSKQYISAEDTIELLQITKQNFTKVAKLGDRVTIVTNTTRTECEQGDACLAESVSAEQEFFVNGVSMNTMSSIVCIFRKQDDPIATLSAPPVAALSAISAILPISHKCFQTRAYADLFDYNNRLSIPRIVDLFERSRNDAFGGPDKLEKLKESGVHVIVVTIQKLRNHTLNRHNPSPGSGLEIRNRVTVSMNGKRLTFGHQLVSIASSDVANSDVAVSAERERLLVECEIVVYSVDQVTHTLKELPAAVLRELERYK